MNLLVSEPTRRPGQPLCQDPWGTWLSKYRSEHSVTEELSLPDRAKLKEIERENRELCLKNDFQKKAAITRNN
jgi:hypothetical protein